MVPPARPRAGSGGGQPIGVAARSLDAPPLLGTPGCWARLAPPSGRWERVPPAGAVPLSHASRRGRSRSPGPRSDTHVGAPWRCTAASPRSHPGPGESVGCSPSGLPPSPPSAGQDGLQKCLFGHDLTRLRHQGCEHGHWFGGERYELVVPPQALGSGVEPKRREAPGWRWFQAFASSEQPRQTSGGRWRLYPHQKHRNLTTSSRRARPWAIHCL